MSTVAQQIKGSVPAEPPEIEQLRRELRHEHEMHVHALAEFEGLRRRAQRDCAKAACEGKREILLSLLELADSFDGERAIIDNGSNGRNAAEALARLHCKVMALLKANQVVPFNSVGQEFDPGLHEALSANDVRNRGAVIRELRTGYRWGDEVLRPARVITDPGRRQCRRTFRTVDP
jgi:molecular chaperone GrpE